MMLDRFKGQGAEKWLQRFCWALFGIHVLWACVHMYFHATGYLNPWKLGGYAMYTKPSPQYVVQAALYDDSESVIWSSGGVSSAFHFYAQAGCLGGVNRDFYDAYMQYLESVQPIRSGDTLKFLYYERSYQITTKRSPHRLLGQADLRVSDDGYYEVREQFCGGERKLSIAG